jgi:hypothetical protein
MPKNNTVFDYKPVNAGINDWKAKNKGVLNTKPKINITPDSITSDRLYDMTLYAGMPMGLLLSLTYPTNIQIQQSKSK